MKKYTDGSLLFEPRVLIQPSILKQIDVSVDALKRGKKGEIINLRDAPNV